VAWLVMMMIVMVAMVTVVTVVTVPLSSLQGPGGRELLFGEVQKKAAEQSINLVSSATQHHARFFFLSFFSHITTKPKG